MKTIKKNISCLVLLFSVLTMFCIQPGYAKQKNRNKKKESQSSSLKDKATNTLGAIITGTLLIGGTYYIIKCTGGKCWKTDPFKFGKLTEYFPDDSDNDDDDDDNNNYYDDKDIKNEFKKRTEKNNKRKKMRKKMGTALAVHNLVNLILLELQQSNTTTVNDIIELVSAETYSNAIATLITKHGNTYEQILCLIDIVSTMLNTEGYTGDVARIILSEFVTRFKTRYN